MKYLVLHVSMEGGGERVTCTLYFMSVWRVGGKGDMYLVLHVGIEGGG